MQRRHRTRESVGRRSAPAILSGGKSLVKIIFVRWSWSLSLGALSRFHGEKKCLGIYIAGEEDTRITEPRCETRSYDCHVLSTRSPDRQKPRTSRFSPLVHARSTHRGIPVSARPCGLAGSISSGQKFIAGSFVALSIRYVSLDPNSILFTRSSRSRLL